MPPAGCQAPPNAGQYQRVAMPQEDNFKVLVTQCGRKRNFELLGIADDSRQPNDTRKSSRKDAKDQSNLDCQLKSLNIASLSLTGVPSSGSKDLQAAERAVSQGCESTGSDGSSMKQLIEKLQAVQLPQGWIILPIAEHQSDALIKLVGQFLQEDVTQKVPVQDKEKSNNNDCCVECMVKSEEDIVNQPHPASNGNVNGLQGTQSYVAKSAKDSQQNAAKAVCHKGSVPTNVQIVRPKWDPRFAAEHFYNFTHEKAPSSGPKLSDILDAKGVMTTATAHHHCSISTPKQERNDGKRNGSSSDYPTSHKLELRLKKEKSGYFKHNAQNANPDCMEMAKKHDDSSSCTCSLMVDPPNRTADDYRTVGRCDGPAVVIKSDSKQHSASELDPSLKDPKMYSHRGSNTVIDNMVNTCNQQTPHIDARIIPILDSTVVSRNAKEGALTGKLVTDCPQDTTYIRQLPRDERAAQLHSTIASPGCDEHNPPKVKLACGENGNTILQCTGVSNKKLIVADCDSRPNGATSTSRHIQIKIPSSPPLTNLVSLPSHIKSASPNVNSGLPIPPPLTCWWNGATSEPEMSLDSKPSIMVNKSNASGKLSTGTKDSKRRSTEFTYGGAVLGPVSVDRCVREGVPVEVLQSNVIQSGHSGSDHCQNYDYVSKQIHVKAIGVHSSQLIKENNGRHG